MAQNSISDLRVKILSVLADSTRLEILQYLSEGERCVCEIIPAFQRSQSAISKHLNVLYEAGILERRFDGKRTLYSIRDPQVFEIIKAVDVLSLGRISQLAEVGKAIEVSLKRR